MSNAYHEATRAMLRTSLIYVWTFILDTIAPPDPEIRRIERLSCGEFIKEARETVGEPAIKGVISFLPYRNSTVKSALIELKSYGNKNMAKILGMITYEMLLEELSELEIFYNFTHPLVIPVPITRKKYRARGWNQCDLIVDHMKRVDRANVFEIDKSILVKIRETEDQVGKNRSERLRNLKNSFAVPCPEKVRGRNVIVLDDIVTTGATLREARKVLKKAGAKKVVCVAIAH